MDALAAFFDDLKTRGVTQGNLLGFFNVLIGRRITAPDGTVLTRGLTWRELSVWLKKVRWAPEAVREIGLDPDDLPPRDRQRYWYSAITLARVDSRPALEAGERFAEALRGLGYDVGPGPKA
jgi:hypothetical protein